MVMGMAKYADITPFYEWLDWLEKESNTPYAEYETLMFYEIRDKLDDLQEVVLCKDCKHCRTASWDEKFCTRKQLDGVYAELSNLRDDDFCSYGERKYNENNS
jgi:hypothetical protein